MVNNTHTHTNKLSHQLTNYIIEELISSTNSKQYIYISSFKPNVLSNPHTKDIFWFEQSILTTYRESFFHLENDITPMHETLITPLLILNKITNILSYYQLTLLINICPYENEKIQ